MSLQIDFGATSNLLQVSVQGMAAVGQEQIFSSRTAAYSVVLKGVPNKRITLNLHKSSIAVP
jgi:hypothetical protein